MANLIQQRIAEASNKSVEQESLLLREIIQEISLLGLWRAKFFEHAAFYGGTALRILYGLDRFSEDLDFTLLRKTKDFDISSYLNAVSKELTSFDFDVKVEKKKKNVVSAVQSAFVKADSQVSFIIASSRFKPQKGSLIKVKFEVDTDAVSGFDTEACQFFWPQPFSVVTCDRPSLMAGKLHAAFCRGVRDNIKGRDWYDLIWYVGQKIQPNWRYLESKMRDSGNWQGDFSPEKYKVWAKNKIMELDIEIAKNDIRRFISDSSRLDAWSHDLFKAAIDRL
jgi:predicted nucleotidyltransferase component of viral defense system